MAAEDSSGNVMFDGHNSTVCAYTGALFAEERKLGKPENIFFF